MSLLVLAVAAVLGWQADSTVVPAAAPSSAEKWQLATRMAEDPASDLAILTARRPWDDASAMQAANPGAANGAGETARWRLAGVIERSDAKFALVATGPPNALKYHYYAIGEALPDGSTLAEIAADMVIAKATGPADAQRIIRLFQGTP